MHFWRKNKKTGQIYVNQKSDWFMQVQGQMHICKKERCLLAVWCGKNTKPAKPIHPGHKMPSTPSHQTMKFWPITPPPTLLTVKYL